MSEGGWLTRRRVALAAIVVILAVAGTCWATRDGEDDAIDPSAEVWTWRGTLRDPEPLSELPEGTRCAVVAFPQSMGFATAAIRCGALALHRIPCPCRLHDADGRAGATPRLTCACERIFRCDTRARRCDLDASRLGFALHVEVDPTPKLESPDAPIQSRGIGGQPR